MTKCCHVSGRHPMIEIVLLLPALTVSLRLSARAATNQTPPLPPLPKEALSAAASARDQLHVLHPDLQVGSPLVPGDLAAKAAKIAAAVMPGIIADIHQLSDCCRRRQAPGMAPSPAVEKKAFVMPDMNVLLRDDETTPPPMLEDAAEARLGPPPPPRCPQAPPPISSVDVALGLAPFKPAGAIGNSTPIPDDGLLWRLSDGGWSFQYPTKRVDMDASRNKINIAHMDSESSIDMNRMGTAWQKNDTVVHQSRDGMIVFHGANGTIHQVDDTLIYHWCEPNVIIYHTPQGVIYYDDTGMTYRGKGVAHYAANGDITYQGVGGITKQSPNGSISMWTPSGVVYRHVDGSMTYTPIGESKSHPLFPEALGPDPFPGPPLTIDEVNELARKAAAFDIVGNATGLGPSPAAPCPACPCAKAAAAAIINANRAADAAAKAPAVQLPPPGAAIATTTQAILGLPAVPGAPPAAGAPIAPAAVAPAAVATTTAAAVAATVAAAAGACEAMCSSFALDIGWPETCKQKMCAGCGDCVQTVAATVTAAPPAAVATTVAAAPVAAVATTVAAAPVAAVATTVAAAPVAAAATTTVAPQVAAAAAAAHCETLCSAFATDMGWPETCKQSQCTGCSDCASIVATTTAAALVVTTTGQCQTLCPTFALDMGWPETCKQSQCSGCSDCTSR